MVGAVKAAELVVESVLSTRKHGRHGQQGLRISACHFLQRGTRPTLPCISVSIHNLVHFYTSA